MIKNKNDLVVYLKRDKEALGAKGLKSYFFNNIWRFQRALRKHEYHHNRKSLLRYYYKYKHNKLGEKLGFTIPINCFGKGLSIAHYGTICVNGKARIGDNCRIHVCVNIGASRENSNNVPKIGDNCYIGPGAKLYGAIEIGDNVSIGANSVVNKSFDSNVTIVGVPARVIK
ncbi:serine O-acetyltransferase [Salinivibrio kushneri]|uniref:Serine acetyltransferase n=1 Tax=Salinivibrio kushneri TaxID=1908198 RepID=A0AA47LQM6_9GAMM|nr:DapH/DapD/GlmU-related protein [Salinivibrio kushneri]WBA07860.1 DapH/DapD/GlmU-related protein [Salinivibrio kushneri]